MTTRRTLLGAGLGALAASSLPLGSQAQQSPTSSGKPITLLVSGAAGGGNDTVARLISVPLAELLNQPVVVTNRTGAGNVIAGEVATRASPDGTTLILFSSGHTGQAATLKSLPYDPVSGFTWISLIGIYPVALAVRADSPLRTLADLVREAKKEPGNLSYASPGIGTAAHLIGEWLSAEANITLNHIPYQGSVLPDLLGGRVDFTILPSNSVVPLVRGGKLRALAVTSAQRYTALPDVPTLAETFRGFEVDSWLAMGGPPSMAPELLKKLNAAVRAAVMQPKVRQQLLESGIQPQASSPEELRSLIVRQIDLYRGIVRTRKLQLQ